MSPSRQGSTRRPARARRVNFNRSRCKAGGRPAHLGDEADELPPLPNFDEEEGEGDADADPDTDIDAVMAEADDSESDETASLRDNEPEIR